MATTAKKTQYGTYEIFRDGKRISTTSASGLSSFGLSETQLSSAPISQTPSSPTPTRTQPTPQQPYQPYTPPQKTPQQLELERLEREKERLRQIEIDKFINIGRGAGTAEFEQFKSSIPTDIAQDVLKQFPRQAQQFLGTPLSNPSIVDFLNSTGQASDFGSRAVLAQRAGIQNYLGTAQQNTQLLNLLRGGQQITSKTIEDGIKNLRPPADMTPAQQRAWDNAVALIPKGDNSIITTDTAKGADPIEIATSTSDTTRADSTAAGADSTAKSIQEYIALLTPPDSDDSKGVNTLIDTINTELEGLKGRGQAQLSEEEAQGVQIKKQLLQNAQNELNQKLAEYKSIQAKYEALNASVEGEAITMSSIIGQQAQVNRAMRAELNVKASEIAMIQANVAGAQGNLDLAQEAADRAVDLKYEDTKDAIQIRLQQLELLQDELSKDEKIRTQAIELYLNQQQDALDLQRDNEKDKNSTLLNIMQKYNDAGITLKDTIESANRKIVVNSAIYRKEVKGVTPTTDTPTDNIFTNVENAPVKDLKTQLKEKFSQSLANKIIADLNDEQTREFMRDYQNVQNELGMSLDPELFLTEWKKELGLEDKTATATGKQYTDDEVLRLIDKGATDQQILDLESRGVPIEQALKEI